MKRVLRYETQSPAVDLFLPAGLRVLHVGCKPGMEYVCFWALVDTNQPKSMVRVTTAGTGWDLPDDVGEHAGTAITPRGFVWHVFLRRLAP